MMRKSPILLAVALACACGGDSSSSAPDASTEDAAVLDASPDATPDAEPDAAVRSFTVVMNRHFMTPTGLETVAKTVAEINAEGAPEVRLASDLSSELTPTSVEDGLITFDNLPIETLWVEYHGTHYVTDHDSIDLSVRQLGRSDKVEAETSPTNLVLNVTDMDAWQDGDQLQLFSAGVGTWGNAMQAYASSGAPMVDATDLVNLTYDLTNSQDNFLIDGSAGDTASITHLSRTTDGSHNFAVLTESFEPDSFTMSDGGSTALSGAFVAVPQDQTLTVDWNRGAFDSALRDQVPSETLARQWLILHTLPGPKDYGQYDSSADLLLYVPGYIDDTSVLSTSWTYGNPFPTEWTRALTVNFGTYRWLTLPGGPSTPVVSWIQTILDADAVPEEGMDPVAGPAADFQVNGATAYGTLDGVGLTPTLSWSAPLVGQADTYMVGVVRVYDDNGEVGAEGIVAVITDNTSVTLPAGYIESGQSYLFYVRTFVEEGIDMLATPYETALPAGVATVYSSRATP